MTEVIPAAHENLAGARHRRLQVGVLQCNASIAPLAALERLDRFAHEHYGKRVIELAVRWTLDQPGVSVALWGARHPEQLDPVDNVIGWKLDAGALCAIESMIRETVTNPVGPEFMAPPARSALAAA